MWACAVDVTKDLLGARLMHAFDEWVQWNRGIIVQQDVEARVVAVVEQQLS